ncbi:ATP-binding protein [Aliiroseovarius crassostreae]|uniref:ATP-binding protein n=1 Tax=Aliiroseovarius crassostreae TaxID=154981 RepID=UPI003C7D888B
MKIDDILAQERRARMAAERLLAQKQAELSNANKQLSLHARNLSEEIVETREEMEETLTENTLVKADLERATKEVVIAKRRLWDSLETIEDGFAVFDQDECMIAANSAYLKPFDGLECIAPGITYVEMLQAALDEGVIDIEGMRPLAWRDMMLDRWRAPNIEPHTLRLWDGTYIKLVDRRSSDGDTVSLGLDITDTINYEAKLKDARFKAEAANRAKSAFLANMSHEIRTPMNGVMAIAELMADGDLDEEQRLYIETIRKSGEALLTIINDVLDYSKIEAAKLTLHPEEFDLEAKLHDVVTLLQPSVQEKGLQISIDFDIFMPTKIKADPVRIGQILTNLIGNAVKFTSKGHVLIRVLGLPVADGATQKIHITVEDSGIGIPVEMQDHIFGEFNQVEDERNRRFDGTGLGLAITRQLVDLMGGEIWVESEEGIGSCFGLHFTAPVVEDVKIPKLPLAQNHALLLMEDGLHSEILEKSLLALGLNVTTHPHCNALPADMDRQELVFLQENLPEEFCQSALNELHAAKNTPYTILLTSPNAIGGLAHKLQSRVDTTLMMPILRRNLFQTLEQLAKPQEPAHATAEPASDISPSDTPQDETAAAINALLYAPNPADLDAQTSSAEPAVDAQTPAHLPEDARTPAPINFASARDADEIVFLPSDRAPAIDPAPIDKVEMPDPADTGNGGPSDVATPPFAPLAEDEPRTMRVLAAEDNRTNQLVFSKLVKALDIDLKFANNGREALELFQDFEPDLIFMDISMPEMDGKEATQCIRALEAEQGLERTKIVALTAHAMTGDAEEILSYGLDKHLTKPLKKPLILGEIEANCPSDARPPLVQE